MLDPFSVREADVRGLLARAYMIYAMNFTAVWKLVRKYTTVLACFLPT